MRFNLLQWLSLLIATPVVDGFIHPSTAMTKASSVNIPSTAVQTPQTLDSVMAVRRSTTTTYLPLSLRVMTPPLRSKVSIGVSRFRRWWSSNITEVQIWRALAVTTLSSICFHHQALDTHLARFWTYLTTSSAIPARIFRTDSYEWCLAVTAFGVFIHAFGYADRAVRRAAEAGGHQQHPWRQYRLQDRYMADQHRRRMMQKQEKDTTSATTTEGKGVSAASASTSPMPPVQQSPWHWKAWILEFWVYVAPLLIWDIVAPRRARRLGAFAAPTTLRILRDIPLGLFLYDFFFFCGHWMLHKVPFLYRWLHKKHHTVEEVRACDQVRLSVGEEVYDVGCSIVALNLLGVHPVARSLYNIVIVFLLCELHSGFDFPWSPQNVVPGGIVTGSRRHHYHHRFGHHYYQKFFFTVDRLFGFFQKDDGSLKGESVMRNAYVPPSWKTT